MKRHARVVPGVLLRGRWINSSQSFAVVHVVVKLGAPINGSRWHATLVADYSTPPGPEQPGDPFPVWLDGHSWTPIPPVTNS